MAQNVIFVSSEAAPFAKTGGLADVSGSLPAALGAQGCNVCLFMPFYRQVAESGFDAEPTGVEVTVPIGPRAVSAEILKGSNEGVTVYFIKRDEFFDRSYLYGTPVDDYFDNLERFVFFSRAVLEAIKALGLKADVIHCNDWQSGLIPAYLKDLYRFDNYFAKTSTVFTIHNIAYQGLFPAEFYGLTGLSGSLFTYDGLEFWGRVSLLKAGIVYSELVTTVSKAYSREIQTPDYGHGLDPVLRYRSKDLYGILNGVDYGEWDPATDALITSNYSPEDMAGKAVCRRKLLREFGLKLKKSEPVVGMVTRLTEQKGVDILCEAVPEIAGLGLGLVVVGTGEKKYQDAMIELAGRYHGRLSVKIAFDNRLAHMVEAGSDIFLMPSRYEPCGLNQIYSLKYGTIPVVRATGGLDDTVREYRAGEGTGFKFKEYTAASLAAGLRKAVEVFKDKEAWAGLQARAMKEDFSWESSALRYIEVYRHAAGRLLKKKAPSALKTPLKRTTTKRKSKKNK